MVTHLSSLKYPSAWTFSCRGLSQEEAALDGQPLPSWEWLGFPVSQERPPKHSGLPSFLELRSSFCQRVSFTCDFILSPSLSSCKKTCSAIGILLLFCSNSLSQERPEPPSPSQVHLHDNFHWAWSTVPAIPWKRGEPPPPEWFQAVLALSAEFCLRSQESPYSFLFEFLLFFSM